MTLATSGKMWRMTREEGIPVKMPSGKVALLRSIGPDLIIRTGRMPAGLEHLFADLLTAGGLKVDSESIVNQLKEWVGFVDTAIECMFVDPKIVENPTEDNEISISDIDWSDKVFCTGLIFQPTHILENFRERPEAIVEPVRTLSESED